MQQYGNMRCIVIELTKLSRQSIRFHIVNIKTNSSYAKSKETCLPFSHLQMNGHSAHHK
jgi:hypothetical protein